MIWKNCQGDHLVEMICGNSISGKYGLILIGDKSYKMLNMKYRIVFILIIIASLAYIKYEEKKESGPEPWTASQLLSPTALAAIINNPTGKKPMIISVGPGALIKGSLDMGPVHEKENLEKLKQQLSKLPKDADIVIYCGCCPFEH